MQQNIQVDLVLPNINAANPKQLFRFLAAQIAEVAPCFRAEILDALAALEKKEGSAIGEGLSLSHARMKSLSTRFVALATLERPLHFNAPDSQPVDIVAILLSPESDGTAVHLHSLSRLTRMLKNPSLAAKLRDAKDADTIKFLLIDPDGWLLAA
jgi:nitrogen PTS system EIIA component